jgi:Amidohydrolase family/Trypsin
VDAGESATTYPDDYEALQMLASRPRFPVRISNFLFAQQPGTEFEAWRKWTAEESPGVNHAASRLNGYLLEGAGEVMVWGAHDFENFMEPRPEWNQDVEAELTRVTRVIAAHQWPIRMHATHDDTITRILDLFERVFEETGYTGRWAIDHAETIKPANIARIKAMAGGIAVQNRLAYSGEFFTGAKGNEEKMRRVVAAGVAMFGMLVFVPCAGAITYGVPDGNGHPEVGALLAQQAFSVPSTGTTYWGTCHANPGYNQSQSDPQDLAVVVLDKSVKGITPARLPAAGSLSGLAGDQQFTSVGYGAQAVTNGAGGKTFHYADVRYVATGTLNSIKPSWLRISQNPATGNGGTCYGDSGGPNFLGAGASETNILAATTITGDTACRSTNVDYRLDTASARAFLAQYVALP